MNTAEIVVTKVQSYRGFQIVQLLRESIGQSGKASHLHSHGQVLSFHETSRDALRIGFALSDLGYNLDDRARGVFCRAVVLPIIAVQFHELSEINFGAKRLLNRIDVKAKSVCRDLYAISKTLREIVNKLSGGSSRAFADGVAGYEFGISVQRHKNPLVAKIGGIVFANPALLFANVGPNFIALYNLALQVAHLLIHNARAFFSGQDEQLHDRVTVQPRHAFRGANRAAFNEALDSAASNHFRGTHGSERANGLGVRKGCGAGRAAVTLDSVPTVAARFLNCGVLAFRAGHVISPLALCGETSQNSFGSEAWVTPRFGLAPLTVPAGNGALSYNGYGLGRWFNRDFYDWPRRSETNLNSDCHSGFAFRPQRLSTLGALNFNPKSFLLQEAGQTGEFQFLNTVQRCKALDPFVSNPPIFASGLDLFCLRHTAQSSHDGS